MFFACDRQVARRSRRQPPRLTHGDGVAAAFDFVGSNATLELAISSTRTLGKVSQIGLAGGSANMQVLRNCRFEVQFEATLWGTIRELREVPDAAVLLV